MRVLALGTGAGRPTLQRHTSATALEYEGETFLFDCGEATQLQLIRSPLKWGKLTAIFIGHLHGDHLYGLPGLLGTLSLGEREETLRVFGPAGLQDYLRVHQETKSLWINYPLEVVEIEAPGLIFETERYQVFCAPLSHLIPCWGYAFRERPRPGAFDEAKARKLGIPEGPERMDLVRGRAVRLADGRWVQPEELVGPPRPGRSFAYCLDTRPCPEALELARGVDLLVHEATFGAEYRAEAHQWGHSCAEDAAHAAREAGVKRLILTHLSQRYTDPQSLLHEARAQFPATEVAEDLQAFFIS
ncbi:MAG: ribonuclease Z [Deltaproteobacteria bacterium]|nr:ribonuclease Z [Deltaproteobacteria bacterium]